MRHNNKNKILRRERKTRKAVFVAMSKSLIAYGKIETTEAKAKAIRPIIERLITYAKTGGLANQKRTAATLGPTISKKLFERVAGGFFSRNGGYTRILKKNTRTSDNAPVVIMELV